MTVKTMTAPDRFAPLCRALDGWADAGRIARFFWRDDDAVSVTPALENLAALSAGHGAPVLMAVIPQGVHAGLAARLAEAPLISVAQHGWSHANHAPSGEKKCELHAARPLDEVKAELAAGRRRLTALFGAAFLPILVPPWNRAGAEIAAALPGLGFSGLSTHADRRFAAPGLAEVNTHVDPQDRRVIDPDARFDAAVRQAAARLDALRTQAKWEDATGLLTHHLTIDAATWDFVAAFVQKTTTHPAARWAPARELFGIG